MSLHRRGLACFFNAMDYKAIFGEVNFNGYRCYDFPSHVI